MGHPLGRLKRREDFLRAAAARNKRVADGFVLQARARADGQDEIRVGYTASRKVGSAVKRNRTKRRLRAVANDVIPRVGTPGTDYVLIGRNKTATISFDRLESDLLTAVMKLNGRKENRA